MYILEKRNLRGLVIDHTLAEEHSMIARTTDHVVADGSAITDHTYVLPKTLRIRGCIGENPPAYYLSGDKRPNGENRNLSDNPLAEEISGQQNLTPALLDNVTRDIGVTHFGSQASQFNEGAPGERIQAAWRRIEELRNNRELVTVVTNLGVYDSMFITQATANQDGSNSNNLMFTIELKHISFASPESASITKVVGGGSNAKTNGKQNPRCVNMADVFSKNASVNLLQEGDTGFSQLASDLQRTIKTERGNYTTPFNSNDWNDKICGGLSNRYQRRSNRPLVTPGPSQQAAIAEICEKARSVSLCNVDGESACGDTASISEEIERRSEQINEDRKKAQERLRERLGDSVDAEVFIEGESIPQEQSIGLQESRDERRIRLKCYERHILDQLDIAFAESNFAGIPVARQEATQAEIDRQSQELARNAINQAKKDLVGF